MTSLHPSAHFLIGFATAMLVAFLLCACLSGCATKQEAPDAIDVLVEGRMQSLVGTMFNTDGTPK